jgi:hypothetical protein
LREIFGQGIGRLLGVRAAEPVVRADIDLRHGLRLSPENAGSLVAGAPIGQSAGGMIR